MREIKYRGKTIDGKWLYGSLVNTAIGNTKTWIVVSARGNGGWFNVIQRNYVKPETVGQFTGLHDKNGKEIYEGDVVEFDCYSYEEPDNTYTGEIIYSSGNACFVLNGFDECGAVEYRPLNEIGGSYTTIIKILGNVHDNPDLLKEDNHAV